MNEADFKALKDEIQALHVIGEDIVRMESNRKKNMVWASALSLSILVLQIILLMLIL